ncbi:MAG TPA: hypothetical protein VGI21_20455 [Streptosporangiaceae bacterium]
MRVIRRRLGWRWAVVAGGLAVLCVLPALAQALPVHAPAVTAAQLRSRILNSGRIPYSGYAESNATFGLPSLPGLSDVTSLLDGVTRMQVWQASPSRWRLDVLSDTSERDTYQLARSSYVWDSGNELLTRIVGRSTVRLPQAADFLPPSLASRLVREAGSRARLSVLAPRRVAGQATSGLRVVPADPASTVGQIDIWVAAGTGLPLDVQVYAKGARQPALETHFFQVGRWRPDPAVLTPQRGPGTGYTTATASSLAGELSHLAPVLLPIKLAGQHVRIIPDLLPIGIYGTGLSTFAVLAIGGSAGQRLLSGAETAGGTPISTTNGTGVAVSSPLVSVVLMHRDRPARADFDETYLLAGLATLKTLEQAAATLVSRPGEAF